MFIESKILGIRLPTIIFKVIIRPTALAIIAISSKTPQKRPKILSVTVA